MHAMSKKRAARVAREQESEAYWGECEARVEKEREEWWARYNKYLKSPVWAEKRRRVMERDNHLCQACCKRPAEQVHHLTYERVCNEPLFDLISICVICHNELHPHMKERNEITLDGVKYKWMPGGTLKELQTA
tara:strand:+ start:982 stop:1383 length:402 start_codon:yes stop_codon:yes gene_type:complete